MTQFRIIDTHMHGEAEITGAFLVQDARTALVETGPKSSIHHIVAGLEEADVDRLDYIVVTHIHLDHAGAAGTLAQLHPEAMVVVHPAGAPHLVDPAKLWASAARIYGADMDRLWGGIDPVAPDRIRVIEHDQTLDLGGRSLRAIETPGHARHHHAFLDDLTGIVFTGDALGVRLADLGIFRPATPPPEFDLVQAVSSISRIQEVGASELWFTHFGPQSAGVAPCSVEDACARAIESLERWGASVRRARSRTHDLDEAAALVKADVEREGDAALGEGAVQRLENTTSYWMNTWGLMRYFDQLEARGAEV